LIIYGDGPLKEKLEDLVFSLNLQGRVVFMGVEKNISEKIKSAKLFVLSSIYEGLPNSLMEAMALGLPCISTDCPCGGPKMLLNPDFLVNVNDCSKLSELMLKTEDESFFNDNYRIKIDSFREKNVIKEWFKVML
jgi:Glycosyltransferase